MKPTTTTTTTTTTARTAGPPTPREVLGVPMLPPARASAVVNRLRARLLSLHRGMAPPPLQILESLFGLLEHRVLVALCEAGVPEVLTAPMEVAELARRTESDPDALERLVRYASTAGWLRIDRTGIVSPTAVTEFLHRDHPGGWRAWVDFAGGADVVAAVQGLSAAGGADPFEAAHGVPFFDWMARHPDRGATFDGAMAAGGRMHALGLAKSLSWKTPGSVCDVGGGTGALLAALLDLVPGLEGTVLDVPSVIGRAVQHERLTALAGDAFASVPTGFDTYLLVNVVHDWSDDDAARILATVAEAAAASARIVVVEAEATVRPIAGVAVAADVLMAALTPGGHERTTDEIRALGQRAGLRLTSRNPLASGDTSWIFRPGRPNDN
jgi:hypothetical protein